MFFGPREECDPPPQPKPPWPPCRMVRIGSHDASPKSLHRGNPAPPCDRQSPNLRRSRTRTTTHKIGTVTNHISPLAILRRSTSAKFCVAAHGHRSSWSPDQHTSNAGERASDSQIEPRAVLHRVTFLSAAARTSPVGRRRAASTASENETLRPVCFSILCFSARSRL